MVQLVFGMKNNLIFMKKLSCSQILFLYPLSNRFSASIAPLIHSVLAPYLSRLQLRLAFPENGSLIFSKPPISGSILYFLVNVFLFLIQNIGLVNQDFKI